MDLYMYNLDEYSNDSRQGNEFAPAWPFRLIVSGSSDSGKTTMLLNLIMGDKKAKEGGERYVLCDDVVLFGRYLDEPKWSIIKDFFNELVQEGKDVSFKAYPYTEIPDAKDFDPSRATLVVFEDLMNMPKKIQERIADYFSSGRHSNISAIYTSQRYFLIPKTIRENATHTSIHRGAGSLPDLKRIVSQYTEDSEYLAPVIDDLIRKREFIVFDHRRSRNDPLSIRVRWDTSLRSITDHPRSIQDHLRSSKIHSDSVNVAFQDDPKSSKFSLYGKQKISQAKETGSLIELAKNMPNPEDRNKMMADGVRVKNGDIWARYIYREAFDIKDKNLGPDWVKFKAQMETYPFASSYSKQSQSERYRKLLASRPLDDKKIAEGLEILLWFLSNGFIDQEVYMKGCAEILPQIDQGHNNSDK